MRDEETRVLNRKGILFVTSLSLVILGLAWLASAWMGALTIPGFERFFYSENDVIMQVSLDNTAPLTLSVKAKSNCSDLSVNIVGATVKNYNQTTVAEYWGKWVNHHYGEFFDYICELPDYGSEKLFTLNFETTLPPGSYTLWFCAIGPVTYSGTRATRADVERGIYPFAHVHFTIPYVRPYDYV